MQSKQRQTNLLWPSHGLLSQTFMQIPFNPDSILRYVMLALDISPSLQNSAVHVKQCRTQGRRISDSQVGRCSHSIIPVECFCAVDAMLLVAKKGTIASIASWARISCIRPRASGHTAPRYRHPAAFRLQCGTIDDRIEAGKDKRHKSQCKLRGRERG